MNTQQRYVNLDECADLTRHHYTYSRIVKIGTRTVRAHITRDNYQEQSTATAEVLADNMTWTHLLHEPTINWFADTVPPGYRREPIDVADQLGAIAELLIGRATAVILARP